MTVKYFKKQLEEGKIPEEIELVGYAVSRAVYLAGFFLSPRYSQKIKNHSEDGFNWGYNGASPNQLALAILVEYFTPKKALEIYKSFTQAFIQNIKYNNFHVKIKLKYYIERLINEQEGKKQKAITVDEIMSYEPVSIEKLPGGGKILNETLEVATRRVG